MRRPPWLQVLLGVLAPLAVTLVVEQADRPGQYRPFSVMLGVVVLLAVVLGREAAWVSAVVSGVLGWYVLTPPERSLRLASWPDTLGLLLYVLTVAGVVVLVGRLERSHRHEVDERAIVDALLDQAPVGIGMVDPHLRFLRVNRRLAQIDGSDAAGHLGRTTEEIQPAPAALDPVRFAQVRDSGVPVGEQPVSHRSPEGERHWRVGYYPVPDAAGTMVGVGTTVEEVTAEVVRRERVELLLRVSRAINRSVTVADVERLVMPEVSRALACRLAVVAYEDSRLVLRQTEGYDAAGREQWRAFRFDPSDDSPLSRCLRADAPVVVHPDEPGPPPTGSEVALRAQLGDCSYVWTPVTLAGSTTPVAAFSVAWPNDRVAREETRLMLATVAAVVGAAVARIETAEAAAADRFRTAMDAMTDQVAIARAVRRDDGRIEDFELEFLNRASVDGAGRSAADLVGRRVRELYPNWVRSGLFDAFCEVVETGRPLIQDRVPYTDTTADGRTIRGFWNLQVVKVDDGYIAASRDVTELVDAERAARAAERAAEMALISVDLLQRAALPEVLPAVGWVELGAHYRPAQSEQAVGGDWYDAFDLGEDRLGLVIADVSGHGVEAAALMVQVRNMLRAFASEDPDPGRTLTRVNEALRRFHADSGLFVTACLAVLDGRAGDVTWSLAGHLPPVLVRSGRTELLAAEVGPPLAPFPDRTWPTERRALQPGDQLVLYTDGLVERRGESIDDGIGRLRDALLQPGSGSDSDQELAEALVDGVIEPQDDVAVLTATFRPVG